MRAALLSAVILLTLTASAQTSVVAAALDRLAAADTTKTRFTDHKLSHTTNTEPDGTDLYTSTELYEETWINDLPYQRLLRLDGKPLTGQREREEQQRYDAAIAGRRPLGTEERIHLNKAQSVGIDANPLQALSSGYTLREQNAEAEGHEFVAEPSGAQQGGCGWRYTLWIAEKPQPFLTRYRAEATNHSPACDGAWQEVSYTLVDGIPKPAHAHAHFFQLEAGDRITIDGDDTYTDYRRFTTHITIGPATIVPPGGTPR